MAAMGDEDDVVELDRHHGGSGHRFQAGALVEVNDHEMGDVYFSATVIQRPLNGRRTKKGLYVEYNNLLASEDLPDPLQEYVDISTVRPAPPSLAIAKPFAVNDVVNAFYNDGWWKGTITRAVGDGDVGGGGERFVVVFEKPPDEQEFRAVELRPHWDWVDGVWAGLQNLGGVVFGVGEKVEVSFEGDDDAWFPAVIARDLENGGFLVEFKGKDGSLVKGAVGFGNVRPSPPGLEERGFGVSERVEAFLDFRWRSGLIVEKKNKNVYNVLFENLNLEKEFDVLEVRAHMDWKDGRWFVACSLTSSNSEIPTKRRRSDSKPRRRRFDFEGGGVLKKHKCENEHANQEETGDLAIEKFVYQDEEKVENVVIGGSTPVPQSSVSCVLIDDGFEAPNESSLERIVVQEDIDGSSPLPLSLVSCGLINESSAAPNERSMERMVGQDEHVQEGVDGSSPVRQRLLSCGLIDESSVAPNERSLERIVGQDENPMEIISVQEDIDGSSPLPLSLVSCGLIDKSSAAPNERSMERMVGQDEHVQEGIDGSSPVRQRLLSCGLIDESSVAPNERSVEKIVGQDESPVEIVSVQEVIDGSSPAPQSLVSCGLIDESSVTSNARANQETEPLLRIEKIVGQDENPKEISSDQEDIDGSVTPKEVLPDSEWPFAKHSVLWKNIESMEVFRKTPQKPHFQPLRHSKEPEREGLAIGLMVTLSDVVERSCSLKIRDPRCAVEDLTPTLLKLEEHGFDLGMVRQRMMKLLEAKDIEEELVKHECEKRKIDGEIRAMMDDIRRLQEQLELAQIDNANKVEQIEHLQAKLEQIQRQIDQRYV